MNESESESDISQASSDLQEIGQFLFSEICQMIDTAKQRAAAAINEEIIHLNNQQQQLSPKFSLKDSDILDFIGLSDYYPGKDFKNIILRDIEKFLLEMGAGFTFVARQKRLQIDDDDFYIDLLFYNRKLKRLVAIDLKIGNFRHEYKSQMELYLRWLAKYEQESDEKPPLGIILCAGKKQEQIELLELDKSDIHVAEYLTVLPSKELLKAKLQEAISSARRRLPVLPEPDEL
jgi:predicted nuclease of restriction endonuclease-like (RecB) superfamily